MASVNYNIMKEMQVLYKEGLVQSFEDVFTYVQKSTIAREIGMGIQRFDKKKAHPGSFTPLELENLADAFGMDVENVKKLCRSAGKGK